MDHAGRHSGGVADPIGAPSGLSSGLSLLTALARSYRVIAVLTTALHLLSSAWFVFTRTPYTFILVTCCGALLLINLPINERPVVRPAAAAAA